MSVLITGGTGFLGLALAQEIIESGQSVVSVDTKRPSDEYVLTKGGAAKVVFEYGDIRDERHLKSLIRKHQVEKVVLAATITSDVEREKTSSQQIVEVNIGGVAAGLQACGATGVARVLLLSSGSVYGGSGKMEKMLHESVTPTVPENLYAHTKLAAENIAQRLAGIHEIDLSIGRVGTCFGPLEHDTGVRDTLSPHWQIANHARNGLEVVLPRYGIRDWLYSADAAAGAVALLNSCSRRYVVYNLGAGFIWSIADWCKLFSGRIPEFKWRLGGSYKCSNINFYAPYDRSPLSISRLLEDTEYTPQFDMSKAFEDFVEKGVISGGLER